MAEKIFCYACRTQHPKEKMRLHATRRGLRWRCERSIEGAHSSAAERDAFGRQQTLMNREQAQRHAEYTFRHPLG